MPGRKTVEDDLPIRPKAYVLGSDLDRHAVHDLEALERELVSELERVRRTMVAKKDVRSAAEALFKASSKPVSPDG